MDYDESELRLGPGQSVDWIDNRDGALGRRLVGQGSLVIAIWIFF